MITLQHVNIFFLIFITVILVILRLKSKRGISNLIVALLGIIFCAIALGISWFFRGDHMKVLILDGTGGFEKLYLAGLSFFFGGCILFLIELFQNKTNRDIDDIKK